MAIRAAKARLREEQAQFVASATKEEIYRRYRRVHRTPKKQIPVLVVGNRLLHDRKAQVQALNPHFSSAGDEKPGVKYDNEFRRYVESIVAAFNLAAEAEDEGGHSSPITFREVKTAIARLGPFKAPGPDKTYPLFLKNGGAAVMILTPSRTSSIALSRVGVYHICGD